MSFTYRGQAYDPAIPALDAPTPEQMATFRGQTYRPKRYTVHQRYQPSGEFSYRGVRYQR